ncbi:hypothetical protein AGMMS49938_19200 [Fibrobacterales bacterium]|nr:hypothetical protein AGMMS49938_19200 [Fibrobacterales bacterium]
MTAVGFDSKLEEPQNPDLIIENNGNISVEECVKMILEKQ